MAALTTRPIPAGRRVEGQVTPPPSKSVTHRYFNLVLLADRPAVVRRPLLAEDTRLFLDVLRSLGWEVEASPAAVELRPPAAAPADAELFCGNAGTLFRFLIASLSTVSGRWRIDGTPRLRERPAGPLAAALEALGARVEPTGRPGHAPLDVHGPTLEGGSATLDAGDSSQYLSALLMACLRARHPSRLLVPRLTSSPYVELTRRAIRRFVRTDPVRVEPLAGASAEPGSETGSVWRIAPAPIAPPGDLTVEGDWSAACYPAAAAAITGGRVLLRGLDLESAQGDRRFLDLLARMGARVERDEAGVWVEGGGLEAIEVDLSECPDQVPTLAAVAPFAFGTTRIYNVSHLRIKESDRLRSMARGLSALGVPVEELPDGLVIEGCWAGRAERVPPKADREVTIDPADDHRIAMSFALLGLRRPGVRVASPEVVGKSYPAFWDDLDGLLL